MSSLECNVRLYLGASYLFPGVLLTSIIKIILIRGCIIEQHFRLISLLVRANLTIFTSAETPC
jgi:hypothetical protein